MTGIPGVDPGFLGEGGGGGRSMNVIECMHTERADFCILPCPLYHLLKNVYAGSEQSK